MYKVLLVDDERIILEGISRIVDWQGHETVLIGTARNGLEAFDQIQSAQPDIVISDIRMPGLDGLQLVEKALDVYPHIRFIMLSGFNEFEYARKAMLFGVKHYLLKPCSEQTIGQALGEVVEELKRIQSREQFVQRIQAELEKVMPHAKEQFLKEFVTNKTYGKRDWENLGGLFGIPFENQSVRLILFQPEGDVEYEHLFALTNIAEEWLGKPPLLLSTTIGKHVLLLIKDAAEEDALYGMIENIRSTFHKFYKMDTTIALSESGEITETRKMYRDTLEYLNHRFYLGEGSLITKHDVNEHPKNSGGEFFCDDDKLGMSVKTGRVEDAKKEIDDLFDAIAGARLDSDVVKSYVITLFMAVVRQGNPKSLNEYLKRLAHLAGLDTFSSLKEFVKRAAVEVASSNYESNKSKQSAMIGKVLGIIDDNIGNPMLSLHWVAGEMMYMNADYLGKLFKKKLGDKFSNYVVKVRMEKAIELIRQMDDVKVFELAEMLGFGENPQYFGQVFKKYTGFTPSEYKKTN